MQYQNCVKGEYSVVCPSGYAKTGLEMAALFLKLNLRFKTGIVRFEMSLIRICA